MNRYIININIIILENFIRKETLEYNIGKRNLAKMMGEDPDNFTKENIKVNIIFYIIYVIIIKEKNLLNFKLLKLLKSLK